MSQFQNLDKGQFVLFHVWPGIVTLHSYKPVCSYEFSLRQTYVPDEKAPQT